MLLRGLILGSFGSSWAHCEGPRFTSVPAELAERAGDLKIDKNDKNKTYFASSDWKSLSGFAGIQSKAMMRLGDGTVSQC